MKPVSSFIRFASVLLILTLILGACQTAPNSTQPGELETAVAQTLTALPTETPRPTATSTPLPTATPTEEVIQYGPSNFPADVDPLTGLKVADATILDRRPALVKVSNFPREGRPHAGLSFADIVFDYYTGEGGNRFLALFYGQNATQAGPMRSGRLIDARLVPMYQGILGMVSAYAPVYDEIIGQLGNRLMAGGPNTCPAVCSDGPQTITSVFANTEEMTKYYSAKQSATNDKPNLDGMAFHSIPPAGGVDGHEFTMQFSSRNLGNWRYDPETKKYLRWIEDVDLDTQEVSLIPLTDRLTGEQLQFSNVIVIFSEIETLNGDDSLHRFKIADTKGVAIAFRDGLKYDLTYKSGHDTPIQFFDASNAPFALQPGNTWMHITGVSSLTEEEQPGVWRVILRKP